jgi:hypothetical protein
VVKKGMHHPWLVALLLAGCAGSATQVVAFGPPPPRLTRAALAGPRCGDGVCTCRDPHLAGDGGAGLPADGKKRFEIRVGPSSHELWVTIGEHQLYKSAERAEDCFYVDLPSGVFPVALRASNHDGVSAALAITELGTKTRSWYDSFRFACGTPGVCSSEELDDARARYAAIKRGIHDPCGSVRIKGLTWDTGVMPDHLHPGDLAVRFQLEIYRFAPWKAHGDASCGEGGGRGPGGGPAEGDGGGAGGDGGGDPTAPATPPAP